MAAKIDKQAEKKYAQEKLKPTPETVTATSSTHAMFSEVGTNNPVNDVDMLASVKHDIGLVKETFDMKSVPRQAYLIGLAGVLPYLGTSLSTVFCAWEINHSVGGIGSIMTSQTAETFLHILEPLQVGYGAVILSFLGAIHWGLEFARYGGQQGYKRYAIGVFAPAVAWPTLLMPIEYALITQFAAFTLLYYIDTKATYRGWTPPWYSIYRFVLTFIVGGSIVVSLIGRGEVNQKVSRPPGAVDRITALREAAQESLIREERELLAKKAEDDSSSDTESGAGDDDKEGKSDEDNDNKDEDKDKSKSKSKDKNENEDKKEDKTDAKKEDEGKGKKK